MEINETTLSISLNNDEIFNKNIRLTNLIVSSSGILSNLILLIILLLLNRHQCTTYFLLILMIICDFLYCIVYTSILLTIDNYLNIINHQILCPLSFFLTPFTFTGSTLLLFICLLHLITNYIRKYNTILGQIGGRLSVIFVFAFIIIRSVLGSTSIELISDLSISQIEHCTIDMNTPEIVTKVQNIIHVFAEVTDILVYIGWIIILLIYFISFIRNKIFKKENQFNNKTEQFELFINMRKNHENNLNRNNFERITNKERHNSVSLIIISISFLSILFYFPVMLNKYITMNLIYQNKIFLNDRQIYYLQFLQQTTHLFCLTIRFIPFILFDKRIRSSIHHIIGFKIQKKHSTINQKKFIFHCQCSRRQNYF